MTAAIHLRPDVCLMLVDCKILFQSQITQKCAFEAVWDGKCRSRCLKINRVIKLAAGAASPMTKMQGSPRPLSSACRAVVRGLPCILVIGEAALAADLVMASLIRLLVVPGQ